MHHLLCPPLRHLLHEPHARLNSWTPPMSYTAGLSRSSSNASSISFLSSHYSDDDLPSPLPDSPYPGPRDLPESTPDYSPATSYALFDVDTSSSLAVRNHLAVHTRLLRPRPHRLLPPYHRLPHLPSDLPITSPFWRASEERSMTWRIPQAITALYWRVSEGLVDGLWQGQASTNHLLDQLREREREPHVAPDTELNDRMNRIEDLLQSIVNQPREAPQPQPPIVIHTPGPEREPSDSASES
ncbi:hypothetical protein B0H11DRAFT_195419 [Mycena galericulata]|nr:hypothetical protein B0H11DRAFT_195419 [Mycena galericulata]